MHTHLVFNRTLGADVLVRRTGDTLRAYAAGDDEPAAVGSLTADGRIDCSVEPRYRDCGIERELVALLEADARAAGIVASAPRRRTRPALAFRLGLAR